MRLCVLIHALLWSPLLLLPSSSPQLLPLPLVGCSSIQAPCNLEEDHARLLALSQESLFYLRQTAFSARVYRIVISCHLRGNEAIPISVAGSIHLLPHTSPPFVGLFVLSNNPHPSPPSTSGDREWERNNE